MAFTTKQLVAFTHPCVVAQDRSARFDCRVVSRASASDALACLVWRRLDATRNLPEAILRRAGSKEAVDACKGQNTDSKRKFIKNMGIKLSELPLALQFGSLVRSGSTSAEHVRLSVPRTSEGTCPTDVALTALHELISPYSCRCH